MGYSYCARTGRLACDSCGATEGKTRKRTCPHKVFYPSTSRVQGGGSGIPYCQPAALCPHCYAKHKATLHQGCAEGAAKRNAELMAEHERIMAGGFKVTSRFGFGKFMVAPVPEGKVGICFTGKERQEVWALAPEHYGYAAGFNWLSEHPAEVLEPWPNHQTSSSKQVSIQEFLAATGMRAA